MGDKTPNPEVVPVAMIRTDGSTQIRVKMSPETIESYKELYESAWEKAADETENGTDVMEVFEYPLPPVILFYDDTHYWPADGFHRAAACRQAGIAVINAIVLKGTQRDALLYAIGANAEHGLQRTNQDKRNAVRQLLSDPEWKDLGPTTLAAYARVSRRFVYNVSLEMDAESAAAMEAELDAQEAAQGAEATPAEAPQGTPAERTPEAPAEVDATPAPAEVVVGSEAELSDDDWLNTLPIYSQVLSQKGHGGREFAADALAWRALQSQKTISVFKRETQAVIDFKSGGTSHFTRLIVDAARIPHPSQWKLCPTCKGSGTPCRCGAGYNIYVGIEVKDDDSTQNQEMREAA